MRSLILISAILLILSSCDEETPKSSVQWTKLGLDGRTVNKLKLRNDLLFIAASDGLYKLDLQHENSLTRIGFEGKNVQGFAMLTDQHIIASLVDKSYQEPPTLHLTTNQGQTWSLIDNNFGGEYDEPVFDLTWNSQSEVLYATGPQVVAKSGDNGVNWTPIWGQWGGFGTGTDVIEVREGAHFEIWAGGQGAIENGYLLRSTDETAWDQWSDLVDNPTVVKAIAFDAANPGHVYAGYEGALIRTRDGGNTWEDLILSEENRFFFGVSVSQQTRRVYTAGWLKRFDDPQPLKLFYSSDEGGSWEEAKFSPEDFGGVYQMVLQQTPDADVLFLGLYKGGLYQAVVPNDLDGE